MTLDVDALLKLITQLGGAVVMALALWWALLVPRRDRKTGEERSALLVVGWEVDAKDARHEAETKSLRQFYVKALADAQDQAQIRISEWRGFRDEAVAKAKDAEDDRRTLLEAMTNASRDIAILLEIVRQLREELHRVDGGGRGQPGDQGRG